MGEGLSKMAKQELLATIRGRYGESSKGDKSRILDEFIAVTGYHRKHGIRLLGQLAIAVSAPCCPWSSRHMWGVSTRRVDDLVKALGCDGVP